MARAAHGGQQPSPELRTLRLEELHELRTPDRTLVQAEQEVLSRQASDVRDVLPFEMALHDRGQLIGRPSAHLRGPLGLALLVDEANRSALGGTPALSAGQVLRFDASTGKSLRSMARRSGCCEHNPIAPS